MLTRPDATLTRLSASELVARLRRNEVSARTVLEAHLSRYRACHDSVNAVVRTDIPTALAEADRLDAMAARGRYAGELHGLPMTVKDTFDAQRMPASAGRSDYGSRPIDTPDAALVARLRAAGAVIWGKSNTSYMALGHHTANELYGRTSNPFDLRRSAGGSSGGSAAAVAACVSPLELGSDIGGSLRVPAHFCGVYALKPSFGLLPMTGHVPPSPGSPGQRDLEVAGPLARHVSDLRLALRVLAPRVRMSDTPPSGLEGKRIAVWKAEGGFFLSEICDKALRKGEKACMALGAHTARARPDISARHLLGVYMRLLLPVIAVDLTPLAWTIMHMLRPFAAVIARSDGYGIAETITAATASHRSWLCADSEREQMSAGLRAFFGSWDAILTPVAPINAFEHPPEGRPLGRLFALAGREAGWMSFWSVLASALGLPALVVPAGMGEDGLPVGLQLIGPSGSESDLLDMGEALSAYLESHNPALLAA